MVKNISLIVSRYVKDNIFGASLVDEKFSSVEEAKTKGNPHCAPGFSVLIRPNYNEKDEEGKFFFREWRSFNGEEYKEIRWYL